MKSKSFNTSNHDIDLFSFERSSTLLERKAEFRETMLIKSVSDILDVYMSEGYAKITFHR